MQLLNPIRRLFGASKPGNTSIQPYREPKAKVDVDDDAFLGWQLNANGKVYPIKQGSGWYGSGTGYGEGAFTETAIGAGVALTQSVFGWAAAYSVSTWVYRCIELRKQSVNRMPWYIYSKRTGKRIDNHPLAIALNRRTAQHPFKKLEQSQLLFGETFFEPMKNEYGFYSDLRWLNNLGMAVIIGAGHIQGYTYTAMQGGRAESFEYDDIAFMKTDNPFNDLRGMSPTEVILDEIAIDKDVARVVRSYYANDTRVGLLLIPKHNLNPADNERFMEIWKAQNQGVNKAGKPVLMPYDMSVERVQNPMTLDDMSLRESTRREIAAGYGVPLSMAGGWDDAKYQSLPEQRKSFYEETIIPECENIADFINQDVIEYFDDKAGRCGFKFDFSVVLALTEDAQRKGDMYSQRLTSGGITRAEYRQALGHTSKPEDEVYYIPAGVTIVPANEAVLVTPQTNQVQETPPGTPDDPSAVPPPTTPPGPDKPPSPTLPGNVFNARPSNVTPDVTPRQQPGPEARRPQGPPPGKSAQGSVEDELRAWEKKALNSNPVKASSFVASQTPPEVQEIIRTALKALGKDAPPQAIKTLFKVVRTKANTIVSKPPAELFDYWKDYDGLMADLGDAWLSDYMSKVDVAIGDNPPSMNDVQAALDAQHDAFQEALLGTEDNPGILVRLVLAGMAAGNQAIVAHSAANPQKPTAKKDGLTVAVDWNLLNREARAFAKQYFYTLIRNVDDTTRLAVQKVVTAWIESGEPLSALQGKLSEIFHDATRAQLIAQTESTRAYAAGSTERYRRADIKRVTWNTVRMPVGDSPGDVCPMCDAQEKRGPTPVDEMPIPPLHPGCLLPGTEIVIPGKLNAMAESFYDGRCVEIITANGHRLSVTANHPILTPDGWIGAQFLGKGQNVLRAIDSEWIANTVNPDDDHRPVAVEQVFGALKKSRGMFSASVPVSSEDFHGDGRFINGNVNVINADGLLWRNGQFEINQPIGEKSFSGVDTNLCTFHSQRAQLAFANSGRTAFGGLMSTIEHRMPTFFSGVLPTDIHAIGNISRGNASGQQATAERPSIDVGLARQFAFRFACQIATDEIVEIRNFTYTGHVYDLQCDDYELYIGNSIIAKNCRCWLRPVVIGEAL